MSVAIKKDHFTGNSKVSVGEINDVSGLAAALRSAVDDITGIKVATIVSPNATDTATAVTLVNEIKASLNAVAAYVQTLTKAT